MLDEWRDAWRPGVVALIAGAICWQMWISVSSLFVEPMQAAHGWSRGDIAYGQSVVLFCAFAAPLIGRQADRVGVRKVLLIGVSAMAAMYLILGTMGDSLTVFYLIYTCFALAGVSTTGMTFTRLVNRAFIHNRGTALAVSRLGIAVSSAVAPLLIYQVISHLGYRAAFVTLAVLLVAVALPLIFFWAPAHEGPPGTKGAAYSKPDPWRALLKQPKVLLICLAAGLNYGPVLSMLMHFKPIGISKGLDPQLAVEALSMIGVATIFGALLSGFLVDRIWAPIVACILNLLPAIGCIALSQISDSKIAVFACAFLIGIGQGAENDIVAFMIARYFGMRNYGAIYGLGIISMGVFNSTCNAFTGWSYDHFGNYNPGLIEAGVSFALAAVCYLAMGRYPSVHPDSVEAMTLRPTPHSTTR